MEQDDHGIMAGRDFMGAPRQQGAGIALGQPKFAKAFDRDEGKQQDSRGHAALLRETHVAVKPGPMAVKRTRGGRPDLMMRSSTKKAVGADMLPYSASTALSWSRAPCPKAKARSKALRTLAPPGWNAKRPISAMPNPARPRISAMAGAICASAKGGIARSKITPRPCGSTDQPMMPRVSGQRCWPLISTSAMPGSPARNTQAAAPSPNNAVATMLALVKVSVRNASEQSSTATSNTTVPGRDSASREAIESPDTAPAQPRPKTGTRSISGRKPIRPATRASRLGVAMPVDEIVTTVSTSAAPIPAASSALVAASKNNWHPPSR